jgi:hypothetical protein
MCNVTMLRTEPYFCSIPLEQAIYCENCRTVSNSAWQRCGVCGSEALFKLSTLLHDAPEPDPPTPAHRAVSALIAQGSDHELVVIGSVRSCPLTETMT